MFTGMSLANFRGFKRLAIPVLSRVNLIVGKNSSGKTSLLEAVEVLAGGGSPASLVRGPRRRAETVIRELEARAARSEYEAQRVEFDIRHVFHGHNVRIGTLAAVAGSDDAGRPARAQYEVAAAPLDSASQQQLDFVGAEGEASLSLKYQGHLVEGTVPITPSGGLLAGHLNRLGPRVDINTSPVTFLGTEGLTNTSLARHWDSIVLGPHEARAIAAMRIIHPDIDRIAFVASDDRPYGRSHGIFVKASGSEDRIPLGSMGDGIRRLLTIGVLLAQSSGGYLLVDEIDTGLHHSTLEQLWRLVIETARALNIQVFATTHSGDCVRTLAWLVESTPELAGDLGVYRIDADRDSVARFDGGDIVRASQNHIELRG